MLAPLPVLTLLVRYQAQHLLGFDECELYYVIEGNVDASRANGDRISRVDGRLVSNVENDIAMLEEEGFRVLRSSSAADSMSQLAALGVKISEKLRRGTLKAKFTLEAFQREVGKLGDIDFSRLAKDHYALKKKEEEEREVITLDDSDEEPEAKRPKAASVFGTMSKQQLEDECVRIGVKKSGNKDELKARLSDPKQRPPSIVVERKNRPEHYVPIKANGSSAAVLCAILTLDGDAATSPGWSKDQIWARAEALDIKETPFAGGTTQTGPFLYDGWSCVSDLMSGEVPLITRKNNLYKLTTASDVAGKPIATALHQWCHELGICKCAEL